MTNNRFYKLSGMIAACLATGFSVSAEAQTAEVKVDVSAVEANITPWLYGSCIEDVNHEIYGGIYDQKIYGESFEEPDRTQDLSGFSKYEGIWSVKDDVVAVSASRGGKIIYRDATVTDGTIETYIRFDNNRGDMAGIVFRVSDPAIGRDRFKGYAVNLSSVGSNIELTKHNNNVKVLKSVNHEFNPYVWNLLRIDINGPHITVSLNDKKVLEFTDEEQYIRSGKFGLRDLVADVYYKDITYTSDGERHIVNFDSNGACEVSSRWSPLLSGSADGRFYHDLRYPFHGKYSQGVEFLGGEGRIGVSNMSLNGWGIAIGAGKEYTGYVYLKADNYAGEVTVALENEKGTEIHAKQTLSGLTDKWKRYEFSLRPETDDDRARFSVSIDSPGKIWIDMVMLQVPEEERFKGVDVRKDIAQAMVDQGLTFLRYGGTMVNVPDYKFKNMIGDRACRPPYRGHWNWWSTNGFGIEEFLQLAEAAGFTPSFAVSIEEDPQDMADMVEYLNGPITSEWGAKRAENGHPEPYGVKYIEIGNEEQILHQSREGYDYYIEKFIAFHDAMKAVDPSLELIIAVDWKPQSQEIERVFKALDGLASYWDYHPWADPMIAGKVVDEKLTEMKQLFHKWNPDTKMKCAIFEENGDTHNMRRTLGHVTLQNAVRRHGDFVLTSCAANALQPYRQNDNSWNQGQIFFTPVQVWGMPPYYAQKMASENHLPLLVKSEVKGNLDVTATRNEHGDKLVLHIANTANETLKTVFDIRSFGKVKNAKVISLSGKLDDVNTPEQPDKISPVTEKLQKGGRIIYDVKPYSYTILVFEK